MEGNDEGSREENGEGNNEGNNFGYCLDARISNHCLPFQISMFEN